ncbi:3-isopropylmalate dehydratase large subunit [Candidatus Tisiphia endosymbiont of Temnostethus pusillus]|uniref:3-isopropylmalate dehydratase large subunit n=1 Tax=Candidatus Tisiphia endosymbiont of Temnostethus pusillus TaxID=3139335 RepID=UPI0035C925CD
MSKTLLDKLWDIHLIGKLDSGKSLLHIDKHLIHEVTSPLAFEGLKENNLKVWNSNSHFAVADHNVPTEDNIRDDDSESIIQVEALKRNSYRHNIKYFGVKTEEHGIVHVISPELGITQPGISIVCGDSHTSTHGAFGALAFGIGTSDIEQVLATQTISIKKPKSMLVNISGNLGPRIYTKDIALYLIRTIGSSGGKGYAIEYQGNLISDISLDARMTLCNMAIEAGFQISLIAPDDKVINYLKGKKYAPTSHYWEQAVNFWRTLYSDNNATFNKRVTLDVQALAPMTTWGTNLDSVVSIEENIPQINEVDKSIRKQFLQSISYMGLQPGQKIAGIKIDKGFIGSCTNSRLEDLREAAQIVLGKKVKSHVEALVVPGSEYTKRMAENEGLHHIFQDAGFSWRNPGCSMCLGMNADRLQAGQRCASSSNRNFEGRQGRGGRTHLMSPAMVAAAAIAGEIIDVRKL